MINMCDKDYSIGYSNNQGILQIMKDTDVGKIFIEDNESMIQWSYPEECQGTNKGKFDIVQNSMETARKRVCYSRNAKTR